MRFCWYALTALLSACSLGGPAVAQDANPPEHVAAAYYAAVEAGDWGRVVALTHPDELSDVKALVVGAIGDLPATADSGGSGFFGTTQAGALQSMGLESASDLERLPPDDVYRRFLTGTSVAAKTIRALLTGVGEDSEVLGHLTEGRALAHVVRRVRFTGEEFDEWGGEESRMDVLTVKRDGDGWRVVADTGFSMAVHLRAALTR